MASSKACLLLAFLGLALADTEMADTLSPAQATTLDDVALSALPSGNGLVMNNKTFSLANGSRTTVTDTHGHDFVLSHSGLDVLVNEMTPTISEFQSASLSASSTPSPAAFTAKSLDSGIEPTRLSVTPTTSSPTDAAGGSSTSSTAPSGAGFYIAQGLGLPSRSATASSSTDGISLSLSTTVHTIIQISTATPNRSTSSSSGTTRLIPHLTNSTALNITLAPTGSGFSYANACNQASYSWTKEWVWYDDGHCGVVSTILPSGPTAAPASAVSIGCDGIPRMVGNYTTPPFALPSRCRKSPTTSADAPPQPKCSILPDDCKSLYTSFSAANNVPTNVELLMHGYATSWWRDFPRCSTEKITCTRGEPHPAGAVCGIYGPGIRLLYWPQKWKGNSCDDHSEIITMGPTISGRPNTKVIGNFTATSPTVYVSYSILSANNTCDGTVGPTLTNGIIPLNPSALSSKVPWFYTDIPWEGSSGLIHIARSVGIEAARASGWPDLDPDFADQFLPFQYADLNDPVPAAAYYQVAVKAMNPHCWYGGCPTIGPSSWYRPGLSVPSEARLLASEWHTCRLPFGDMGDPPSALVEWSTAAPLVVPPTTTAIVTSVPPAYSPSATPCVTPDSGTPVATSASLYRTLPTPDRLSSSVAAAPNDGEQASFSYQPSSMGASIGQNNGGALASLLGLTSPAQAHQGSEDITTLPNAQSDLLQPGSMSSHGSDPLLASHVSHVVTLDGSMFTIGGAAASGPGQLFTAAAESIGSPSASSVVTIGSNSVLLAAESPPPTSTGQAAAPSTALQYPSPTIDSMGNTVVPIGNTILTIGGPPITINGRIVSAGASGLVIQQPGHTASLVNGIAGMYTETALPAGHLGFFVGSQTAVVGGEPITVSGEVISAGIDGVVVQGSQTMLSYLGSTTAHTVDSTASVNGVKAVKVQGTSTMTKTSAASIGNVTSFGCMMMVLVVVSIESFV